jgi:hypothetical protein
MQGTTSDVRDLAKSLVSLTGAASVFGVSQLGRLLDLRAPMRSSTDAARRLDSVTRAMTDRLEGQLWTAFDRTDVLQRSVVDLLFDLATLNTSGHLGFSGQFLGPVASVLDPVVAAIDRLLPGTDAEVRWLELRNKFEIYFLVEDAGTRLQISPVERTPLTDLVERAYALGPFLAVWSVEGLGHIYGQQALQDTPSPRGLLTGAEAAAARPGALPMLHAGIGLAFAEALLQPVTADNAAMAMPKLVSDFVRLCRDNSQPDYIGAAYESLGLFTRSFHAELVDAVDRELRRSADDLLGYYWHGVGRATYFAPQNFVPGAEIDWSTAPAAAPHDIDRLNFTAGLAWAVTLVNMRQPAIMEWVIRRHGDVLLQGPAFQNGVASSTAMRIVTTPDASFIRTFAEYRPTPSDPGLVRGWQVLIGQAFTIARAIVDQHYMKIGEIFQFSEMTHLPA